MIIKCFLLFTDALDLFVPDLTEIRKVISIHVRQQQATVLNKPVVKGDQTGRTTSVPPGSSSSRSTFCVH